MFGITGIFTQIQYTTGTSLFTFWGVENGSFGNHG